MRHFNVCIVICLVLGNFTLLRAQDCKSIFDKAEKAYLDKRYKLALTELQIAETCDYKNNYQKQIQGLQTKIFNAIENQRLEAVGLEKQARIEKTRAEKERQKSDSLYQIANDQQILLVKGKKRSDSLFITAQNLLVQTVYQSVASKSLSVKDTVLKALLALEAYDLNLKSKSDVHIDDAIYNCLYEALNYSRKRASFDPDWNTLDTLHRSMVRDLQFDPEGSVLYSICSEGRLIASRFQDDPLDFTSEVLFFKLQMNSLLDLEGKRLAFGVKDKPYIQVYRLDASDSLISKEHTLHRPLWLGFSSVDKKLTLIGADGNRLTENGKVEWISTSLGLSAPLEYVSVQENGSRISVIDKNKKLWLGDLQNTSAWEEITHNPYLQIVQLSPDGKILAIGDIKGKVILWNLESGVRDTLEGHTARISAIDFSPDMTLVASGSYDGSVQVWNLQTNDFKRQLPLTLRNHPDWVTSLCFHPKKPFLYVGCKNGALKAWPLQMDFLADRLRGLVNRTLSENEKALYIGKEAYINTQQP